MLTAITLNLLEELGVTSGRLLKKSPAVTLFSDPTGDHRDDGTMMLWSSWAMAKQDITPPSHYNPNSRYERWLRARRVIDLGRVRKIRYKEDLDLIFCGQTDLSTYAASLQFFEKVPRSALVYFEMDPLWLGVPEFREFLTRYTSQVVRNDFDPARNWVLRRRYPQALFGHVRGGLKETTQVLSNYGAITWKHDDGTAVINVNGTGYFQKPIEIVLDPPIRK